MLFIHRWAPCRHLHSIILQIKALVSAVLTLAGVIQELSIAQKIQYVQGAVLADSDVNDCGEAWSKASWHGPAVEPIGVASG